MSVIGDASTFLRLKDDSTTSKFTFRDLEQLNDPSLAFKLKLSVIGHIDLNAFFAQVEQVRLGLSADDPVVCVQWSSLIAVSYASRKYGIGRMDNIKTAREKCPNVILAHAAVFKKGESHWAYVEGLPSQMTHKVLLDPYRRESRKIILIFRQECDLVEKASVDESYLDLGRLVYDRVTRKFPQLQKRPKGEEDTVLPDLPKDLELSVPGRWEEGSEIRDWDDVCMALGADIVRNIRKQVYEVLGYTTSGGVARNKYLAKLAGGLYKPDNQALVLNHRVHRFLNRFELDDITGMGGKTGDEVLYKLNVRTRPKGKPEKKDNSNEGEGENEDEDQDEEQEAEDDSSITIIRNKFTLEDIETSLKDDELSSKVYGLVRGDNPQELTLKLEVKSMMSRKNFPGKSICRLVDAFDWIRVFVGDLYNRLIELDDESMNVLSLQTAKQEPTIRRPKTVSLHFGSGDYQRHSRQSAIKVVKDLEKFKETLEVTAFRLLRELLDSFGGQKDLNGGIKLSTLRIEENYHLNLGTLKILTCTSMSVTISNFIKTSNSNMIDSIISKGDDSTPFASIEELKRYTKLNSEATPPDKNLLVKEDVVSRLQFQSNIRLSKVKPKHQDEKEEQGLIFHSPNPRAMPEIEHRLPKQTPHSDEMLDMCEICQTAVPNRQEHNDYHVALELSKEINREISLPHVANASLTASGGPKPSGKKRNVKKRKIDQNQSQLPW